MLEPGEIAALSFSGGKDSTALLYAARPFLDRITVYFVDTGAAFPHMREFVVDTCRRLGARLEVVFPPRPVQDHIDAVGLPSDVVPVEATLEMQPFLRERRGQLVQSYMRCCTANIFAPMEARLRADGHRLVLRGSKRSDSRVGVGPSHFEHGIEYRSPLWDWSDERVLAYLAAEGAPLPKHYAQVPDSLDCWVCTAHLGHHGAAKLRWVRENHPELWPALQARLNRLAIALKREQERLAEGFAVAGEPSE